VTELTQVPSPLGPLRLQVYQAEQGITCMRVIPVVAGPDGATGLRVEAVRDGRVVASARADTYLQPLCGPP
jgi:hypothetical protein